MRSKGEVLHAPRAPTRAAPGGARSESAAGGAHVRLAAAPASVYPTPRALLDEEEFVWDENDLPVENYARLGRRLAAGGDLYRRPGYAAGLLLGPDRPNIEPAAIHTGQRLAAILTDRVRVRYVRNGNTRGNHVPAHHLSTMLASEAFLQAFRPVDAVVKAAHYLPDFELMRPGHNDGGPGQRFLHVGPQVRPADSLEAVNAFLGVMAFATPADRANAVALALTVLLRNFWPGAKPAGIVTSTKSHGGKDTVIAFAAGRTPKVSVDYEAADWVFRQGLVAALRACPEAGVLSVENARLGRGDRFVASAALERFLTDPEPVLHSSKAREPLKVKNHLVVAVSTNHGTVSEDLLNRALPVHLNPVGNVADRQSPIGNPKLEYLPARRERIEAELCGMVERWKRAGRPLDREARHPFGEWAGTVGGILLASGFRGFLGNYALRRTADDPLRRGLGLLGGGAAGRVAAAAGLGAAGGAAGAGAAGDPGARAGHGPQPRAGGGRGAERPPGRDVRGGGGRRPGRPAAGAQAGAVRRRGTRHALPLRDSRAGAAAGGRAGGRRGLRQYAGRAHRWGRAAPGIDLVGGWLPRWAPPPPIGCRRWGRRTPPPSCGSRPAGCSTPWSGRRTRPASPSWPSCWPAWPGRKRRSVKRRAGASRRGSAARTASLRRCCPTAARAGPVVRKNSGDGRAATRRGSNAHHSPGAGPAAAEGAELGVQLRDREPPRRRGGVHRLGAGLRRGPAGGLRALPGGRRAPAAPAEVGPAAQRLPHCRLDHCTLSVRAGGGSW